VANEDWDALLQYSGEAANRVVSKAGPRMRVTPEWFHAGQDITSAPLFQVAQRARSV
jgi:hypothetical protein